MGKITLTYKDLRRVIQLHRQIRRDYEQLSRLTDMAEGTGSKPTDSLKVQTSLHPGGNKFADAAADLSALIKEEEDELELLQQKVQQFVVNMKDSADIRIIEMRYLSCFEWQEISELTGYTRRHIFRIHSKLVSGLPKE